MVLVLLRSASVSHMLVSAKKFRSISLDKEFTNRETGD